LPRHLETHPERSPKRKEGQLGIDLFERAAKARGRILKVERRAPTGLEADPMIGLVFLLTFDVGRVLVELDPASGQLEATPLDVDKAPPAGLEDLAEEEPWWRVLGNPLCAVWPNATGEAAETGRDGALTGLCLQFREDDANPKLIVLASDAHGVRVSTREPVHVAG
jgi:hypothetical protein